MCNRYRPARAEQLQLFEEEDLWEVPGQFIGDPPGLRFFGKDIGPWQKGVFVRPRRDGKLQEVYGQWGLIGDDWKSNLPPLTKPKRPGAKGRPRYMTNNARSETLHERGTFKGPWERGQRCLIPAGWHIEPCWETGENVWWRLRLRGSYAYALAGLWNTFVDPSSGEVWESHTMVTVNCDGHPLLSRMHRPDPERPATMQDKRAVVPLPRSAFDAWLFGTEAEARRVLQLPPEEAFEAEPEFTGPPAERSLFDDV